MKSESEIDDWGRPEYQRSDLGEIVRGKYVNRLHRAMSGKRNKSVPVGKRNPEVTKQDPEKVQR